MRKYKEIFKLKKMLENAKIPFDWEENFGYDEHTIEQMTRIAPDIVERYHIWYPYRSDASVCSIIEGYGTYGGPNDKLEIMGLLTSEEEQDSCVAGYLTAEEVFKRIKRHYEDNKRKEIFIMKKVVDEETLKMTEMKTEDIDDNFKAEIRSALNYEPEEFTKRYKAYKKAEAKFKDMYEPFKDKLLKLYEYAPEFPKTVIVGGVKVTYVSPSTRSTIDSKKLKEEEPELAKKFTKTTEVSATLRIDEV